MVRGHDSHARGFDCFPDSITCITLQMSSHVMAPASIESRGFSTHTHTDQKPSEWHGSVGFGPEPQASGKGRHGEAKRLRSCAGFALWSFAMIEHCSILFFCQSAVGQFEAMQLARRKAPERPAPRVGGWRERWSLQGQATVP